MEEPVCEDEDVDDVEDDADDADGEGKVTMHRLVELLIQRSVINWYSRKK